MAQASRAVIEPTLLRAVAIATAVGTIAFLFILDDWRWSNAFLVPDLLVSTLLAAGSLLPTRRMRPVLLTGFATGVGVFSVATANYAIAGRIGIGAMSAVVTCIFASGWLLRDSLKPEG